MRSKLAQSLIEYSLIIVLVAMGIIIVGPYVIRSINAHMKSWEDSVDDSLNDPLTYTTNVEGLPRPPTCNCPLVPQACGGGSCSATERLSTAECTPVGCGGILAAREYCFSDDRCCEDKFTGDCSECPAGKRKKLRFCGDNPPLELGCETDPFCNEYKCLDPAPAFPEIMCPGENVGLTENKAYNFTSNGTCGPPAQSPEPDCQKGCAPGYILEGSKCVIPPPPDCNYDGDCDAGESTYSCPECMGSCGERNGKRDKDEEQCEPPDLFFIYSSCESVLPDGYTGGTLICDSNCVIHTDNCFTCGKNGCEGDKGENCTNCVADCKVCHNCEDDEYWDEEAGACLPFCFCSEVAKGCGEGGCLAGERFYTNYCNPEGCEPEVDPCREDATCLCEEKFVGECSECPGGQRNKVKNCPGKDPENLGCYGDPSCPFLCGGNIPANAVVCSNEETGLAGNFNYSMTSNGTCATATSTPNCETGCKSSGFTWNGSACIPSTCNYNGFCDAGEDSYACPECQGSCVINGRIDGSEQCEPGGIWGTASSCEQLLPYGYTGGTLTCDSNCVIQLNNCTKCGDNECQGEAGEHCVNCSEDCGVCPPCPPGYIHNGGECVKIFCVPCIPTYDIGGGCNSQTPNQSCQMPCDCSVGGIFCGGSLSSDTCGEWSCCGG